MQVVQVYLQPFLHSSLLKCALQLKIAKNIGWRKKNVSNICRHYSPEQSKCISAKACM